MSGTQIPEASRRRVRERHQGRCERCGGRGAQWHHRRSRSVATEHRHCACNGLWLCQSCHSWAHANPYAAIDEGVIVPRYSVHPGGWSVVTYQGSRVWLDCVGSFEEVSPGEREEQEDADHADTQEESPESGDGQAEGVHRPTPDPA